MAIAFSGISQVIQTATGGIATAVGGPFTVLAILKPNATSGSAGGIFQAGTSASAGKIDFQIFSDTFYYETDDSNASTLFAASTSDGWVLAGATKASGTVAPRGHKYVYNTDTWTHVAGGSAIPNASASPGSGGVVQLGAWETSDFFNGSIAVVGCWMRVLSDTEIENLAHSLRDWFAAAPDALWVLDQSDTSQKLEDLTGGGANETSRTGTSVSTDSVPIFGYGHEIQVLSSSAASGATTVNGTVSMAGAGSLSSTVVEQATATLAGAGSLSSTVVEQATATLAGAGSLAANVTQGASATLTGAGSLSSTVVEQATATLAGAGSLSSTVVEQAPVTMTGAGSLTAVGGIPGGGSATLAGAGSLTANATQAAGVTATGAGSVTVSATQAAGVAAAGAGSLTASAIQAATISMAGSGSLTAPARQLAPVSLAAAGVLTAAGTSTGAPVQSANAVSTPTITQAHTSTPGVTSGRTSTPGVTGTRSSSSNVSGG